MDFDMLHILRRAETSMWKGQWMRMYGLSLELGQMSFVGIWEAGWFARILR